jgi:glycosyltransferase involved in cell wall biosynthesis
VKVLHVVQRYGAEVAGGAEAYCRMLSERLARRGHTVEVVTTCAVSYVDWANEYPPGPTEIEGVTVHRMPVRRPRHEELFAALNHRVLAGGRQPSFLVQEEWMRMQGPDAPGVRDFVAEESGRFDLVAFFTYLYATTYYGIGASRVPVVLHPLAHDEPPLYVPLLDVPVRSADGFAFVTPEEQELVLRRFGVEDRPHSVVGIGTDLDVTADPDLFRQQSGLGDRPYVVVVGRVDPGKGARELYDMWVTYKRRRPGPLALVVVGEAVTTLDPHPDVLMTGFVDEDVKHSAVAGAVALVQPSYFESFSMVVTEAWALRRPVLVQGRCAVLRGQCERAQGGIPYEGYAEFETALDLLLEEPELATALGETGRAYVERTYDWNVILDRYERLMQRVARDRVLR